MSVTLDAWRRLWGELGATQADGGLFNQLVGAYSERHRHYHTLQHLRECLAHFDAAASLARRPPEVELALWFHDAVYEPQRSDNEARSAEWARRSVLAAGGSNEQAERVANLVLATQHFAAPAASEPDTDLLLDIDLAILGASDARFTESERQIRAEYAHLGEDEFRTRRIAVVEGFLAREHIYRTDAYRAALEARARANLQGSLARLQAQGGASPR